MRSYLLVANEDGELKKHIESLLKEYRIHELDITYAGRDEENSTKKKSPTTKITKSIGIDEIKRLQKKLFLKPYKGQNKAVIIPQAHTLTTEAQNALLKVLEEPPLHTVIILTTEKKDALLPTIQSRCQIIDVKVPLTISPDARQQVEEDLKEIDTMTIGKALTLSEKLGKNKEEVTAWLTTAIAILHESFSDSKVQKKDLMNTAQNIRKMQDLLILVTTTNANTRHALEVFFLSFTQELSHKQ